MQSFELDCSALRRMFAAPKSKRVDR